MMLMDESGLVQRDLVYIEDGNQLKKDDGSINLDNLVLSGTTIRKALEFQSPTHSFETDTIVMYFLEHLPGTIMDEEQLYELSLEVASPAIHVSSAPSLKSFTSVVVPPLSTLNVFSRSRSRGALLPGTARPCSVVRGVLITSSTTCSDWHQCQGFQP